MEDPLLRKALVPARWTLQESRLCQHINRRENDHKRQPTFTGKLHFMTNINQSSWMRHRRTCRLLTRVSLLGPLKGPSRGSTVFATARHTGW